MQGAIPTQSHNLSREVGHTTGVYVPYSFRAVACVLLRSTWTDQCRKVLWDRTYGFSSSSEKTRKSNQFADVITKAALSSHLFKDPECWSGRGLNPRPSAWRTGALPTELTRRRLINQDWSNIQSKITVTIPWCHRNVRRHYARSTWKAQNEMENR